ncbi:RNA 2',3'-cyclic phosphodiesterase [Nitriliruptor alkaliphilus]|uniref:RNA 2',3'-cyclic phosphodiesterase n=1 Tax=Nitriliruptor alkaliphilus TaxID=427918 RepID=UPI000697AD4C|nr:RNA 2',3'-cyclic phosphodiesterase [Nitriliruptor alkaliphilus]
MSGEPTWRLFVALPIPDHVRVLGQAALAPARDAGADLTWTRPEGWHLTLAFLGNVPENRVPEVEAAVGGAVRAHGTGPIGCEVTGADRFDGRALFLSVADDPRGAIAALGDAIQTTLAAADLPVTSRPVRPHLTLARGGRRGARVTDEVVAAVAAVAARWEADEVNLVRSHLGDGPARYEPVATWGLTGRA